MIDVHCHLAQDVYLEDRDQVIERCRSELKAVITSCAHPKDFDLSLELAEKHKDFVFVSAGLHPINVLELNNEQIEKYKELIKSNKSRIFAVGEIGLDYFYVKKISDIQKTKEVFIEFINLAKEIDRPIVIHARESYEDCLEILEEEEAERVNLHMFGANQLVSKVIKNKWNVSVNTIVLKSKKHKKVVRDTPVEKLMLETDSPWLAPNKGRNDPTSIKIVAEKIAEIKKIPFEEVWKTCGENAIRFFKLPIKL